MSTSDKPIDFLIIGAAKAGTTSLASWLSNHPDVCMSNPKETMFFAAPKLYERGIDWYHQAFFSHYKDELLRGDATPAYSNRDRHPGTPQRVYASNSEAKIVYIVRNPVRKAESTWQMYARLEFTSFHPREHQRSCVMARKGFAEYISDPEILSNLINVCKYHHQLIPWISLFGKSRVHVMFLEDLESNQELEICSLCHFLGLDSDPLKSLNLRPENTLNGYRSPRFLAISVSKAGLHRFVPKKLKNILVQIPLFSNARGNNPKPVWPESALEHFKKCVEPDLKEFLYHNDKPDDFYLL